MARSIHDPSFCVCVCVGGGGGGGGGGRRRGSGHQKCNKSFSSLFVFIMVVTCRLECVKEMLLLYAIILFIVNSACSHGMTMRIVHKSAY